MAHRPKAVLSLLALLGLAMPAAAHAQIPDSMIPLRTVQTELNTFRAEYADNYNKKNAAALAGMYAEDAVFIAADGSVVSGKKAIGEMLAKDAPTFGHVVITSEMISAYGSTGIDVGTSTLHPTGGGEQKSRYLVVLRRQMGTWSIVRVSITPITTK